MSQTRSPVSVRDPQARRAASRRHRRLQPSGLPWLLPAIVVTVGIIYYGIAYTGYASTLDWNGIDPNPRFVGGDNFVRVLNDPVFWRALGNTALFFGVTFVIQTALGLLFAVLLHSQVRLAVVYKVIIFVPVVLAPAIMAPVFRQIYGADGQFNWLLEHLGLGALAQPWIAQSSTAMLVIMSIQIWEWTGLTFVLYYAAIGQLDQSVVEAARIDGAGNIRTIVSIIWPGVRSTTVALGMLGVIGALKMFDVPYLVTIGGPNYATEFLGTYIFRVTIPNAHVGYGSAISILLLIIALAFAVAVQLGGRERERVR